METNKTIITVIILVIAVVSIFLFVLPKYQELKSLEMVLADKQVIYDNQTGYYATVSGVLEDIESRKDILEKINDALPNSFSSSQIVYFLQKNAAENGLALISISSSQSSAGAIFASSPDSSSQEIKASMFTINLSGNYIGFKSFLRSLERSARLFEVNSISFVSPNPVAGQSPAASQNYNFQIEIKAYSY